MGGSSSSKEQCQQRWRQTTTLQWTEEANKKRRHDIAQKARTAKHQLKVLVFGPTGCGKSSFCNGIKTAMENKPDVLKYFGVGATENGSFTKGFVAMKWENIILVDMEGVFEDSAIKDEDVRKILLGKVPLEAKLSKTLEPDCKDGENDYTCVVLVLKPGMDFSEEMKRILRMAGQIVGEESVSCHLVLTHLDKVDPSFNDPKHLEYIFKTKAVEETVFRTCEITGIPPNCATFVRNYVWETDSEAHCDALFIDTFNQIVVSAVEQAEKRDLMRELNA